MAISVVNGYTCYSSCEAAKAKAGQDPHPNKTDPVEAQRAAAGASGSDPAVILDGGLADKVSASAVASAGNASDTDATGPRPPGSGFDLRV